MARYIDADEVLQCLPDDLPYKASVKRVLIQAPTADVVEVVRCKNCKYWENRKCTGVAVCDDDGFYDNSYSLTEENDFCSNGERKQ